MRRGLLALLTLLSASSIASAQAQLLPAPGMPGSAIKVSADEVITRLMTFDHNNDGRVAIGELSERMRPIVARGDRNGDEALDRSEIQALTVAPAAVTPAQAGRFVARQGGYSFGDDSSLSSRRHIEGALEDLRLAADTKDRALPIVRSYAETVEAAARTELSSRLEPLLSPEQLAIINSMLNTNQRRQITMKSPTGDQQVAVFVSGTRGDVTQRVDAMNLGKARTEQAHKAVDQFKTRLRLGDELDRAGLLARLKTILSPEELENYGAALARRPVVASGPQIFAFNGAIQQLQHNIDIVKPAVLIEQRFSVGATLR